MSAKLGVKWGPSEKNFAWMALPGSAGVEAGLVLGARQGLMGASPGWGWPEIRVLRVGIARCWVVAVRRIPW